MKLYLDSAYIAKCYLREAGSDAVLDLVESSSERCSSAFAAVEVAAVFHRHLREGQISRAAFRKASEMFLSDQDQSLWTWIPLAPIVPIAAREFRRLSPTVFLRSADCLHLVSARYAGYGEIYTNDRQLLKAARDFGLEGRDVITL